MISALSISVVIPCYNGTRFLRETLDTVLAQTHSPLEVLVVDDGSTDDSAAIAESYGPPVRVIRQPNQGESIARNRGIDESRGDWIALLDADDRWEPRKLESQIALIEDGVVGIHTNVSIFGAEERVTQIESTPTAQRYNVESVAISNPFYCPSSLLVRAISCPKFPTWTRYAEDLVFCLELVQRGEIRLVTEPLTGYRRHGKSQSSGKTVELRWHATILQWLQENDRVDALTAERIRHGWLKRLADVAWQSKYERRWDDYWKIREYLEQFRGHPDVDRVLESRIYPSWMYQCKDRVTRALGVMQRLARLGPVGVGEATHV